MELVTGLSAAKTGADLLKTLREYLKREQKLDAGEINARLIELQECLLDARHALVEIGEENSLLRAALDDRKRLEEFGKQFETDEGGYWIGKTPYCPVCWENKRQVTRLSGPYFAHGKQKWTCPFDKSEFFFSKRS